MSSQQTIPLPVDERAARREPTQPTLSYVKPSVGAELARRAGGILFVLALVGFFARAAAIFVLHRWTQPNDIEHRQLAMSLLEHGTFYFRDFDYVTFAGSTSSNSITSRRTNSETVIT